jgi:excisionase family DNA binding protein
VKLVAFCTRSLPEMPITTSARTRIRGTRTIAEAAKLLGCSYASVSILLEKGELPFIQVGNRRLPTVAGLEAKLGKPVAELEAA